MFSPETVNDLTESIIQSRRRLIFVRRKIYLCSLSKRQGKL